MGSISLRTAKMQIDRICNANVTMCGGRRPLSTLVDWNFIRRKVKIAYEARGLEFSKNRKCLRKKVDDWKQEVLGTTISSKKGKQDEECIDSSDGNPYKYRACSR